MIKERIFLLQKRAVKQENAVLSQVLQQKKYMQIIRQSRKCQIFVRNIDKTVGFLCHYKYKRTQSEISYSFTKTISMGQHQCPKCERQFARSDSLRRHLTSGICSEDMESETMSENEDSTMSDESDAETSKSHQKEDIFGKYTDKDYGIRDGSDTDYTDEDDEDQRYSRKKSKFDPWQVFVGGAHRYLQDTFNESVQHTVEKHPDIDTEEAEEVAFDKLEPRYRAEVIDRYQSFLKVSKAMKKDPLHKKITATAKRLRDDDEFDEDEALRYAIKKRRYLLDGKLEEYDPPSYSLGEDDESDSLQQSSGSKYAPSQLQQNNFGPKYTQSQLGSGSMFKTF